MLILLVVVILYQPNARYIRHKNVRPLKLLRKCSQNFSEMKLLLPSSGSPNYPMSIEKEFYT